MIRRVFDVDSCGLSHAGRVRELNEDRYLVKSESGVFAVADGMGGHEGGELASSSIVEHLKSIGVPSSAPDRKHPTTYIICEQDKAIPVAAQEQMAAAADRIERLPASHQPMASMPDKLAETLARVT